MLIKNGAWDEILEKLQNDKSVEMLIKNGAWDEILEKLQNDKSVVEIIDINSNKQIIIETSGVKGNWNKALNSELKPNTIYKVDDYSYFTDEAGRVNKVSGELKLETKDRNVYQQGKSVDVKMVLKVMIRADILLQEFSMVLENK